MKFTKNTSKSAHFMAHCNYGNTFHLDCFLPKSDNKNLKTIKTFSGHFRSYSAKIGEKRIFPGKSGSAKHYNCYGPLPAKRK